MKFFSRCKVLRKILIAICLIWGFVTALELFDMIRVPPMSGDTSIAYFLISLAVLIILILITVVLSIIIKDAEEDLNAIKKHLKEND